MTNIEIAKEILNQLGGQSKLKMLMGAKHIFAIDRGLSFRLKTQAKNKINHIQIILNPSDTYIIEFWYIRGGINADCKVIEKVENVYADNLISTIEDKTGYSLNMPRIVFA